MKSTLWIILILLFTSQSLLAQGDGPRSFLLTPKGIWGLNPKWLNLDQNILPAGNILIRDAQISVNVYPITAFHTFSLGGRYAQLLFMVNPGSAHGKVVPDPPAAPSPEVSASGFSDGFVGLKVGLIGAPALNVFEFAKHKQAFSMTGYFRWWYSGTYDNKKPLNLGTNRNSFELGFPMAIPFSANPKRSTWLEIYPSMQVYTTNTSPTLVTQANETHQVPLFLLENHLTHNFTDKFWAGVNLRYQYGGALELDGVKQDNTIHILGAGVAAGYQFLPFLGASADYSGIIVGDNGAQSSMFRLSAVFVYVNTKKLKAKAALAAPTMTWGFDPLCCY